MSTVRVATNFNIDIEFSSPLFHRRLFAWFIDAVVQIIYLIVSIRVYNMINGSLALNEDRSYTLWAIGLLLVLPFLTYHLIMEITMNGQSIGKKIVGIKVIGEKCGRPSISQYLIRWLMRTSDYSIIILLVMVPYASIYGNAIYWGMAGTICLLVLDIILVNTGKQQRLGDILAHTLLVNTRQKENIGDTIFLEVQSDYEVSFPQVLQMSDKDMNSLKRILDTAVQKNDFGLAAMAAEKIKRHLKIETHLEPVVFLETLLRDYNHLTAS